MRDHKELENIRNEFAFVAAHELKNPVSAIRALLDVIFNDKRLTIDPIMRTYLLKIQEADERLLQLVEDLLEVSRGESGRFKIALSPQNMAEHMAVIYGELRPMALGKDVTLKYEPTARDLEVMADPLKLKEILVNLVTNAIKYNVAGGSVTVEHEINGGMLVTRVIDTGIGISEEDLARLFEKFWRSEDVAVRAQTGTGLGLFIVKELVELMGGTVAVRAKRGKGTTISFTLPLAQKR